MSQHLGDLKRLQSKLTARYGAEDELVLQVSKEIELLEAMAFRRTHSFSHRAPLRQKADLAMQPPASR